jgi:hypothetical protein
VRRKIGELLVSYSLFDLTTECQGDGVSFPFGAVSNLEFLDFEVQLAHNTILSTNIHRSFWRRVIPHLFVLIDCANECIRFSLLEFSGHGISFLDATRPLIIFGCDETTHHFWMWDRSSFLDARFAWIKSPLPRMADSIARGCCQQGLLKHNVQADIFGTTHGLGMSNGGLTRRRIIDRGEPNYFLLQQVLILQAIWGEVITSFLLHGSFLFSFWNNVRIFLKKASYGGVPPVVPHSHFCPAKIGRLFLILRCEVGRVDRCINLDERAVARGKLLCRYIEI